MENNTSIVNTAFRLYSVAGWHKYSREFILRARDRGKDADQAQLLVDYFNNKLELVSGGSVYRRQAAIIFINLFEYARDIKPLAERIARFSVQDAHDRAFIPSAELNRLVTLRTDAMFEGRCSKYNLKMRERIYSLWGKRLKRSDKDKSIRRLEACCIR